MNRKVMIWVVLFAAFAAASFSLNLTYRWQFGEGVYGHQVNWNLDQLLGLYEAIATVTSGLQQAAWVASVTTSVTGTDTKLIWDSTGLNYWQVATNSLVTFNTLVSLIATSSSNAKGSVTINGSIYFDSASGTSLLGDVVSITRTSPNGAALDASATVSTGGKYIITASAPANVRVNAVTTFSKSEW